MSREFHPGMGQAVAERTILRRLEGRWETWGDVAERVALGNASLCQPWEDGTGERDRLRGHLDKATLLMSGRHLQHGDRLQATRTMECYTNCSSSATTFLLFYLLMSGSGVGRCYDDDMMLVDWDNAPSLTCALDQEHPDFDPTQHESLRDARHRLHLAGNIVWMQVPDTREGWAEAVEIYETMAFEGTHKGRVLALDFSRVRCKGSPIAGMQGRPASGPGPLMAAFKKAASIRGAGLPRWFQAMYIDHCFAECVVVGGARRSARMSAKSWRDLSVLDFIQVKRPSEYHGKTREEVQGLRSLAQPLGFLWSSNNSILVDKEFWRLNDLTEIEPEYFTDLAQHARKVLDLATECAYGDGTGEPGFINQDKLVQNDEGIEDLFGGEFVGSRKYQPGGATRKYIKAVAQATKKKKCYTIVNPCVTADTWVMTTLGPRQVSNLLDTNFTALVNGTPYAATNFRKTGTKEVYRVKTGRGFSLRVTTDHQLMVDREGKGTAWKNVGSLVPGDRLVLADQSGIQWDGEGSFEYGWLIGQMVGDGGYNPHKYSGYVRFWGDNKSTMTEYAVRCIAKTGVKTRAHFKGGNDRGNVSTTSCVALSQLAEGLIDSGTKDLTPRLERMGSDFYRGFLSGFFDSDGTVLDCMEKGLSVRVAQNNLERLFTVQRMLARLGIISTVYQDRRESGFSLLPDGKGGKRDYPVKAMHELVIGKDNILRFVERIGFVEPEKQQKLQDALGHYVRGPYKEKYLSEVISVELDGVEDVYDTTVDGIHYFDANGLIAHNCSEIAFNALGSFCVIADLVPFFADSLDEAEDACRTATRALIRVNTMDSVYRKEVKRTNRIGVGITGIHEFAWKFFGYGFRDLIDERRSQDFWSTLSRFARAVADEARTYCRVHNLPFPHTLRTVKPSGTVSKLFGLTEGWHLPSMAWYLRWVQFADSDPLVAVYAAAGYPTRRLTQYKDTSIVGFPTKLSICDLVPAEKIVYAGQATPEEQYTWLRLGEKYWIECVDPEGVAVPDRGNQISYTLKYDPKRVSYPGFVRTMKEYQSQVRCCSIMPQEDTSAYEYLPEEPISRERYDEIMGTVEGLRLWTDRVLVEDIGREHLECAGGSCPIDYNQK